MKTPEGILRSQFYNDEWSEIMESLYTDITPSVVSAMEEYAEQFKPKWIPVSERLPKPDENVLILFKYQVSADEFTDISIGCLAYDSDDTFDWWINNQDYPTDGVTHWLPLLEKP